MDRPSTGPDLRPGDAIVTLTDVRPGDLVRLERVDAHTVGLRAVGPGEAVGGCLFRIEAGDRPDALRLLQVRPGRVNWRP